ncbi:MAG: hypothetical protein Q4D21_10425 [Phascolarctobacterium sp.]|nr:hypothetical protein [Phascolarctobacterium sp.]
MLKSILTMGLSIGLFLLPALASAQLCTGMAYIENGNVQKAEADARKDAMRQLVESTVGVNVKSSSEMVNFVLVKDKVTTKSDGYVLIKKVFPPKINGDILEITLDLEVSKQLIESDMQSLAQRMDAISEDSTRGCINVAIIDESRNATQEFNNIFIGVLQDKGFRAEENDEVLHYLDRNLNIASDMDINTQIRMIGKSNNRFGANSIVRGRIGLLRNAEKKSNGYEAVASINCQLVSYDNNDVDVSTGYYYGYGKSPVEAERVAKETALLEASKKLAERALKTNQREYRGGVHNLKTMFVLYGVSDLASRDIIMKVFADINCRVVRSGNAGGALQAYVTSTEYNSIEELKNAFLQAVGPMYPNIQELVDSSVGATKLVFRL